MPRPVTPSAATKERSRGARRAVIVAETYPPEPFNVPRDLARHLRGAGWEVEVVTGWPHYPYGRDYSGFGKRVVRRENEDGVRVLRTWHATLPNRSTPARLANMGTRGLGNALASLAMLRRGDVLVQFGPPLFGPVFGALAAKARGAKIVNVVYDVYPDIAVEERHLRGLVGVARAAEKLQYRWADLTVVPTEGFARLFIERGCPSERVRVVPLWSNIEGIEPSTGRSEWRLRHGIPEDAFLCLYAGTAGLASGAGAILEAADRSRGVGRLRIVFLGGGLARGQLEREACDRQLSSVSFLPYLDDAELVAAIDASDACLVTLAPGRAHTSFPSKTLAYLARGRPVIASIDPASDAAKVLAESGAGRVAPAGDGAELAEVLGELAAGPERLQEMSRRARECSLCSFSRERNLGIFTEVLEGR